MSSEAPSGYRGPRDIGWMEEGEEEERQMEGTLWGQGIRGSDVGFSPTHGPGETVGLLGLVLCILGSPLATWVLGA